MADFGKGDGLGVVDDHDVLARQVSGIVKSLKSAKSAVKGTTPAARTKASIAVGDALSSANTLRDDIVLTRARLKKSSASSRAWQGSWTRAS